MKIFDSHSPTYLAVHASSHAVGATLPQEDEKGNICPCAFFPMKLPKTKKHLTSFDLELIALQKVSQHFRKFVLMKHVTKFSQTIKT